MKNKSVTLNFIMNAALTLSSMIFPLITFPYISRILMPEGVGKVNFAVSVISYFTMFAQLGIPTYGIRACAQVRDDKRKLSQVVEELLIISLVMCTIAYLLLALGLVFVPRLREDRILFVVTGTAILLNSLGVEWLYKGLEQYSYITIRSLIFKIIALAAMFGLVHEKSDYVIYAGITVVSSYASYLLNFFNLRKYINPCPLHDLNFSRHIKMVLSFFAMSCATTIYTNLDTVMLEFMKGDIEVGYYTAAVKVKTVLVAVVTSLGTVLLPRASYYIENGHLEEFKRIAKTALRFVMILAPAMMIYFIIFAKESIFFLSGASFSGSIVPMQLIMPTLVFIGLTNIMGLQMLIPLGKEKMVLYSEIAGAIVDLLVNIVLIPRLASTGAAIGTLMAEGVVLIVQFFAMKNTILPMYRELPWVAVFVGCFVAVGSSLWVKKLNFNCFIALVISALLFYSSYWLVLHFFRESTVRMLEQKLWTMGKKILHRH